MPTERPQRIDVQTIPLLALPSLPFVERRRLPRCAAIYFVLNADGTVLYIGQSINLAVRWAAHHRAAKLIKHQATRIAWLVMEDETLLNAVESACIAYFEPLCNRFYDGRPAGRPPSDAAEFIPFPTRFPKDLLDYIRDEAAASGRPINTQVIWMLEYLRQHPIELKPPQKQREQPQATQKSPGRLRRA